MTAQTRAPRPSLPKPLAHSEREYAVGLGLAYLLLKDSAYVDRSWVHRRVEHIRFLDDRTARRQMSVEFTLPCDQLFVRNMLSGVDSAYVPVAQVRKQALPQLSVWAADGSTLPMLTTGENGELAGACLYAMARNLAERPKARGGLGLGGLPDAVADLFRLVARLPLGDAQLLLGGMEAADLERHLRITWIRSWRVPHEPARETTEAIRSLREHHDLVRLLLGNGTFAAVVRELAEGVVMLVPLPKWRARDRHVVKFAYQEELSPVGQRTKAAIASATLLGSVSWVPQRFRFGNLPIGRSESHQVEVEAPEGLELARAELLAATESTAYDDEGMHSGQVVHLHVREAPRDVFAAVFVGLRAAREGLIYTGPAVAGLIAAILLLGKGRTHQVSGEEGVALLLAVPTALAAFVARPGEHSLATRALAGVRILVLTSGLCCFLVAAFVAAGYSGDELRERWVWSAWVSLGPAVLLAITLLVSLGGRPSSS